MQARLLNPIQPRPETLKIIQPGRPGLDKLKTSKNTCQKLYIVTRKGYFYPVTITIKHMTMNKATISLSASRSYAALAQAVHTINNNLYKDELFAEDRIVLKDFYAKDGSLTHFEITASPLDFFMIGTRYGSIEERKRPRLAYRELADLVENIANETPNK
jgi:hypothetical protein